jgi:hypothetical protein
MADNWEIESADDVAQALDWLRRRMKGKGLVLIAVGVNSVAFSKEVGVSAEDAADLVQNQVQTLRRGFSRISSQRVTRGFERREDC